MNQPGAPAAQPILGIDRDEFAYLAPMFAFMLFVWAGGHWPEFYPWAYVGRVFCTGALLLAFSRHYTPIRWHYWWLGIIMGVVGIVQWIGMDSLLQQLFPKVFALDADKAFHPDMYFQDPLALWAWLSIRTFGASFVVPIMEELFWRDYLWRRLVAPADFKLARVGEWDKFAFFGVAIAFSLVHPQWLTAIGWGLMVGSLLLYTKSMGACIIMHGVTNLLLAIYVLKTQQWQWW